MILSTGEALRLVLDQVDYTATPPNCWPQEMVGAVLPKEVIEQARAALQAEKEKACHQPSTT